ncbi:unnamed protein product [Prunus armeniaca]|uniref:Uncharacterized protein n=1 Tax=Prunus armeniaca TaxID=36596 RepID=A0A6J5V799_PRUAR|nr:unnamed protein product [Prunus armeniaca]CAB4312094.1 unnamed protein product [Prunus armeniaca]
MVASYKPYGLTKYPKKTIVWLANGNNLVQQGSTVELTAHGQLQQANKKGLRTLVVLELPMQPCLTHEISFWPMEIQTI